MTPRVLVLVLGLVLLSALGCHLFRTAQPPRTTAAVGTEPPCEPAERRAEEPPPVVAEPSEFERLAAKGAEAAGEGDVASATAFLERALALEESNAGGEDLVLLRLALFHADPASPVYEPDRSLAELRRLVAEYPATLAGAAGEAVLRLLEEVDRGRSERDDLMEQVAELARRLEEVEATLERREQEMEKIKEILLQGADAAP